MANYFSNSLTGATKRREDLATFAAAIPILFQCQAEDLSKGTTSSSAVGGGSSGECPRRPVRGPGAGCRWLTGACLPRAAGSFTAWAPSSLSSPRTRWPRYRSWRTTAAASSGRSTCRCSPWWSTSWPTGWWISRSGRDGPTPAAAPSCVSTGPCDGCSSSWRG